MADGSFRGSRSGRSRWSRWLHALAVVVGIVLVWRGIWTLLDLYLFPDDPLLTATASILAGLIVLLVDDLELRELM